MMISRFSWVCALSFCLAGCTAYDENISPELPIVSDEETVLVYERDSAYPLTDYESLLSKPATRAGGALSLDDFVGCAYKLEKYPFEDADNLGYPVLDMEKFTADYPTYYRSVPIKKGVTTYESFRGFERYETKMQSSRMVTTGFQLNLGIFKVGSKNTYKEVFNTTDMQLEENVYGELHIKYCDRKYELMLPQNIRQDIFRNYVDKTFVDQLYYGRTYEVKKNYGGFVLTKFLSGGQAVALYSGKYKEISHVEDLYKENELNLAIEASVNDKNSSSSAGVGTIIGSGSLYAKKFQDLKFSLHTLGGIPSYSQFTVPKELGSTLFDLSGWSNSLANPENLSIAELPEESLIPITEFIEEDNLKEAFYDYYRSGTSSRFSYWEEPYLVLYKCRLQSAPGFSAWITEFVTRYGDRLILRMQSEQYAPQNYKEMEVARIRELFPCLRFIISLQKSIMPPITTTRPYDPNLNEFDVLYSMVKFIDQKSGKTYLLTNAKRNGKKIAYTLYDSHVIDDYIFRNLVDRLPLYDNIDLQTIRRDYYLIAL